MTSMESILSDLRDTDPVPLTGLPTWPGTTCPLGLNARYKENKEKTLDSLIHSDDSVTLEFHYNNLNSYYELVKGRLIPAFGTSVELEINEMSKTLLDISKPPADCDEWVKNMERLHEKFKAEMGPHVSSLIKYLIEIGQEGPWKVSPAGVSLEKFTRVDSEVSFEDRRNVTRLFDIYEERILATFRLTALALSFHKADTIDKDNLGEKILLFCQAGMANEKLCSIPMWNKMVCAVVMGMRSEVKHEACEEIIGKLELSVFFEMIESGAFPNKKFGSSLVPLAVQKFSEGDFKKGNYWSNMESLNEFLRVVDGKLDNDLLLNLFNHHQTKVDFSTKSGDVKGPDAFISFAMASKVFDSMEINAHSIRFMTKMWIRTLVLTDDCELKCKTLESLMKIFSRSLFGRAFSVAHFILQPCQETYCKIVQQYYRKYSKDEDDAVIACLDSSTRQFVYHYPKHCLSILKIDKLVWNLFNESSNYVDFIKVKFFCVKYAEGQGFTKEDLNAFETVDNDETARMSLLPTPVAPKTPGNPLHEKHFKTLPYKDDSDIVQFLAKQNKDLLRHVVSNFYNSCKCNNTVCSSPTGIVDSTATLADDVVDSEDSSNGMWGEYSDKQVRAKLRRGNNGLPCFNVGCDFVASDEESLIDHVSKHHESNGFANLLLPNSSEHRPRNTLALSCCLSNSFASLLHESVGDIEILLRRLTPGAPVHSSDSEETLESESEAFSSMEVDLQRSGMDSGEMDNWNTETVDFNVPPSRVASQEEYLDRKRKNDEIVPRILNERTNELNEQHHADGENDEENRGQEDNSAPNHHPNRVVEEEDVEPSYETDDSDYASVIGFSDDEWKEPTIITKNGEQDLSKIFAKLDAAQQYVSCPLCVGSGNVTRFDSETQFDMHIRTGHCESAVLKDMPSFSSCKQHRLKLTTSTCSRCNGVVCFRKSHIPAVERTNAFEFMNSLADGIDRPDSNGEIARFSLEERNVFSEQMMQQCELFYKAGLAPFEVFLAQNTNGKFEILVSGYYKFAPYVRHLFKDGMESDERVKECPLLYENLRITYLLQYNEGTSDYKIKSDMTKSCDSDLPSVVHFFARHIAIPSCYKDVPEERYTLSGQIDPLRIEPMSIDECLNLCPDELNLNLARCVNTTETWLDFKSTRALISNNFPPLAPPIAVDIPIYTEESGIMSISVDGQNVAGVGLDAPLVRLPEPVETAEQDWWWYRSYQAPYANNLYRKVLKICEEHLERREKDVAPTPPPSAGRRGRPRKKKTPAASSLLNGASTKVVKHPIALSPKQPENLVATRRSGRINSKKGASPPKVSIAGAEKTVTFMDTSQQNDASRKRPADQISQEEPQLKQLDVTPLEELQSSESPYVNLHQALSPAVYEKRLRECQVGEAQVKLQKNEMPKSSDSTE